MLANIIADEGRLGKVKLIENAKHKIKPIWIYKVSTLEYSSLLGDSSMPFGLEN